jgi:hypothetical protein
MGTVAAVLPLGRRRRPPAASATTRPALTDGCLLRFTIPDDDAAAMLLAGCAAAPSVGGGGVGTLALVKLDEASSPRRSHTFSDEDDAMVLMITYKQ